MTAAELFSMAQGRRKHDRENLLNHASIVWRMASGGVSKSDQQDFIRYGAMGSGPVEDSGSDPALEKRIKEARETGKLIV